MNIFLLNSIKGKDGTARLSQDIYELIKNNKKDNFICFSSTEKKINFKPNTLKTNPYSKLSILYYLYDILLIILNILLNKYYFKFRVKNIICISEEFALPGFFISKIFSAKLILCCYGTYAQRLSIKNKIYSYIFKKSLILASSQYTKKCLNQNKLNLNIKILKLFYSPNLGKNLVFQRNKLNQFTFVGGYNFYKRRKGFNYLKKVLIHLNNINNPPKLLIIGNFEKYENITYIEGDKEILFSFDNFKADLKLIYPNHEFLGQITDKQLYESYRYSLFNILLADHNQDEYDGFGLIHLEANYCGAYTIGSKLSGAEDAIVYGKSFYPDESLKIFDYIKILINDPYIKNYDVNKIRNINNYFDELCQFL